MDGLFAQKYIAPAVQGSNSIEGINANLDEAMAIIDNEKPEVSEDENYAALVGYRNAMTYVLQIHDDPHFELDPQILKSLHFMMLNYDMTKAPGQWRTGDIWVVREPIGARVYEGPDADQVPALINQLVAQLKVMGSAEPLVRGAMAHLNLTMIHPFKDGNGRMARALQTLIMARDGILSPVFSSIEEWPGSGIRTPTTRFLPRLVAVHGTRKATHCLGFGFVSGRTFSKLLH